MITGLFAGILGLMYFRFSIATIRARRSSKVSLGFGDDNQIQAVVSAHGNAAAYIPLFLILLYTYENSAHSFFYVTIGLGLAFCLGRWLHFKAMTAPKMDFKNRVRGMKLTLLPLVILSLANMYVSIRGLFF